MQIKDASRTPMFLGLDAKAFAFIFPTIFYIRTWTVVFDLMVVGLFLFMRVKKIDVGFAYRRLRARLRGRVISSRPWWFTKKWRNR